MSYDFDYLPDDIWDDVDPDRAWALLQLVWDGHDALEAQRIIDATWDGADPLQPEVEETR